MFKFDGESGFVSETLPDNEEVVALRFEYEMLKESFDEAAATLIRLRAEDEGWAILGQNQTADTGFALETLKTVADKAELQAVGNPLLKKAFELRFNPIFGKGFTVASPTGTEIKPRHQKKIDNPTVQETLFSQDGYEANERLCFLSGNLFIAYNRMTGDMLRIPFKQITGRAVDPDFPSRTAYYQWSHARTEFTGQTTQIVEWLPIVEWWKSGKDTIDEVGNEPVNHDWTVIDFRVNTPTIGHWGIPDVFPALPYAWAYSEYIRDASSLLKAYNLIAWKVVGKSKTQAQTAGVAMAVQRRAGGTAALTQGSTLDAMPKAGLIDMEDGRTIAGLVASATGVSTSALIAVAEGGTVLQAVDGPTVEMARARQAKWTDFYERVFTAMGIPDLSINFPKITEDPIYRTVASLATLRATGAMWADEYREAGLEAMSIDSLHDSPPPPEEFAQAQNALGFITQQNAQEVAMEQAKNPPPVADPLARQGNAGVAGKLGTTDNAGLRGQDNKAKKGTTTDLVG